MFFSRWNPHLPWSFPTIHSFRMPTSQAPTGRATGSSHSWRNPKLRSSHRVSPTQIPLRLWFSKIIRMKIPLKDIQTTVWLKIRTPAKSQIKKNGKQPDWMDIPPMHPVFLWNSSNDSVPHQTHKKSQLFGRVGIRLRPEPADRHFGCTRPGKLKQKAIENGHRNSGFMWIYPWKAWWLSIANC